MEKGHYDIYLIGVGGQGIGLLSETLARAALYAGLDCHGTDTHGMAQRGGIVTSHIRLGKGVVSPFVRKHNADIVVALERTEALRGIADYGKPGGVLVYYDTIWQPLPVRLGEAKETSVEDLSAVCKNLDITRYNVTKDDLPDTRMQNLVVLGGILNHRIIPEIMKEHVVKALTDLLPPKVLQMNLALLDELV